MDTLKMAHSIMGFYEEVDDLTEKQGERALFKAQVYAALAQAEAMQLVAKRLEQFMDSQGVGFEMIEAAERGVRYQKENEELRQRIEELESELLATVAAETIESRRAMERLRYP